MKKIILAAGLILLWTSYLTAAGTKEVYTNHEYGFTIKYPEGFTETALVYPGEVVRLHVNNEFKVPVLTVSVKEKNPGITLEEASRKVMGFLQAGMPGTSDYKVLTEKIIPLGDGLTGALMEFSWLLEDGKTLMATTSLVAIKKKHQFTMTGTTIQGIGFPVTELTKICKTLQFKK